MTSCSSSMSVSKSTKSEDQRSKSCDTVCTSNSSCYLKRRKPPNPLMYPISYSKSSGSSVRQRVMSAKLLKLRSIQNQLNDANYHLSELTKENQILKNLQKRQDKALSKYESTSADLPRLIRSHEEQIRFLAEKNKSQKKTMKELNDLLKQKEEELAKAQEKLNHLEKLNRDKRLLDREKLLDQIEELQLKLAKSDDQNSVLNRKLMLESKTSKQRLNAEMAKHKQCQKELGRALAEIDRLTGLLEAKENVVHPRKNRFSRLGHQQSVSMITLGASYHRTHSAEKLATIEDVAEPLQSKTPVTDIKLEPIKCKVEEPTKKPNGIMTMATENIRNRLSSSGSSVRAKSGDSNFSEGGSEVSLTHFDGSSSSSDKSRPDSGVRLGKLGEVLDSAIQRATDNTTEEFDKKLGDYCSDVMENVRMCSERIEAQKESLKLCKDDTETLLETFKKTQKMESRLKNSLLSYDEDAGSDLIKEILLEERTFQTSDKDRNGNMSKKGPRVGLEDRKKLLATLKAIDDGVDSLGVSTNIVHVFSEGAK